MGSQQSANAQPSSAAAQAATAQPDLPHYTDHLTRRRQYWPRRDDGRLLTCDEAEASIWRSCDYIAHSRAFGIRWLRQQLQQPPPPQLSPLRLTRALYAAPAGDGGACACVHVTAALLLVRCSDVARVALRLVAAAGAAPGAGQLCRWAECIAEYVYGRQCRQIKVRQRAACCGVYHVLKK